jgi:hypothetical protein
VKAQVSFTRAAQVAHEMESKNFYKARDASHGMFAAASKRNETHNLGMCSKAAGT